MADLQSNFAIAITSMVILSIVFIGIPLICMLVNSVRKKNVAKPFIR
jgi:hypothetical protein